MIVKSRDYLYDIVNMRDEEEEEGESLEQLSQMDYRELTTRLTTQEATLSNSIGGFVKGVGDRRARVVQHYALIIAT